MTDLLRPEEVRKIRAGEEGWQTPDEFVYAPRTVERLCRDYLTLWDRNKKLEALIPKRLIQQVGGTETQ